MIFTSRNLLVAVMDDVFGEDCGDACTGSGCSSPSTDFFQLRSNGEIRTQVDTPKLLQALTFLAGRFQGMDEGSRRRAETRVRDDIPCAAADLRRLDTFLEEMRETVQGLASRIESEE